MAETERPEIKTTKGSTKRERREDKMIEYINLTKKAEVDLRKDDFISLQVEAMAESIRESLPKSQAYACLHEMQGVGSVPVHFKSIRSADGSANGSADDTADGTADGTEHGTSNGCTPLAATAGQSAGGRVQESALSRPLGMFSSSL